MASQRQQDQDTFDALDAELEAMGAATTIKARCGACQKDSEYPASGMRVLVCQVWCAYEFFCIHCREFNHIGCSLDIAERLSKGGVRTEVVEIPAEVAEHPPADVGPISAADIADFVYCLGRDEAKWIDELRKGKARR